MPSGFVLSYIHQTDVRDNMQKRSFDPDKIKRLAVIVAVGVILLGLGIWKIVDFKTKKHERQEAIREEISRREAEETDKTIYYMYSSIIGYVDGDCYRNDRTGLCLPIPSGWHTHTHEEIKEEVGEHACHEPDEYITAGECQVDALWHEEGDTSTLNIVYQFVATTPDLTLNDLIGEDEGTSASYYFDQLGVTLVTRSHEYRKLGDREVLIIEDQGRDSDGNICYYVDVCDFWNYDFCIISIRSYDRSVVYDIIDSMSFTNTYGE